MQSDIRGNHLALLPPHDEARCGAVCAIADAGYRGRPVEIAWGVPSKAWRDAVGARSWSGRGGSGYEIETDDVPPGNQITSSPGNVTMMGADWPLTAQMNAASTGTGWSEAEAAIWNREAKRQTDQLRAINRRNRELWG
jgi:hypothetical protein